MSKPKKTTIQDIANYAQVSVGTIDRVIHNRGKVSPIKKKKIEEAIEHLNFNPNLLARTLALGKQFFICTLFPQAKTSQNYWSLPLTGVEQFASNYKDFGIEIEAHEYSLFEEDSFTEQAHIIAEKNPDGVVLAPLFEKESIQFAQLLDEKKIPYVFIDANIPSQSALTYIGPESGTSGFIGARLLNTLLAPADNILVVNMAKGVDNSAHIGVVENGFRNFFKEHQQSPDRKVFTLTIPSSEESDIARELTKFYIKNPDIKGVFVTNSMASAVSKFHRTHELDIKLVGFDLVESNVEELKNGGIEFLISQSPVFQGKRAIQTLFDFFVYRKEPSLVQYVPIDVIMKENVDYYINAQ